MVSASWRSLYDELARWCDAGRQVDFWWRDDDAAQPSAALARLVALADRHRVPLALAVVPAQLDHAIFEPPSAMVTALQHGVSHQNRAAAGQKKTEFPDTDPVDEALARLAEGWMRLAGAAGACALPVLVPPWNRIASAALVQRLADGGYAGLSTFGPRHALCAAPGVVLVNTHVDIIDWHGGRGFVGEELVLARVVQHLQARRLGQVDAREATGWLTHHAVHDAPAWDFMARLFERSQKSGGVVWRGAGELFAAACG